MNQWNYADSFMGSIDILSPYQTISKAIDCFDPDSVLTKQHKKNR
jgi:hypothetical protein